MEDTDLFFVDKLQKGRTGHFTLKYSPTHQAWERQTETRSYRQYSIKMCELSTTDVELIRLICEIAEYEQTDTRTDDWTDNLHMPIATSRGKI